MAEPARVPEVVQRFPALFRLGRRPRRRSLPYVPQTARADCGAACLTMVLEWFGKRLPLDQVRTVVGSGDRGVSADRLVEAAAWFGLRGRGVQIEDVEYLARLPRGSILHWRFRHFVVLDRMTRRGALIVDPATGHRKVSMEELRQAFTGIALTFEPTPDFEPAEERKLGLRRYVAPILEQSEALKSVVLTSILLRVLALALPLLTALLVDRVVPRADLDLLHLLCLGLAVIVVFSFLSTLVRSHLFLELRTRLDSKITLDFLDHLVDLPYAFFQQRSAGDLMMRLNSNATVREMLTSSLLSGVMDGALVVLYLALLCATHLKLGLVVLGLGALRIGLFLVTRKRHQTLMSASLQVQAVSRSYQVQMLAGIETLKAIGAEKRAVERWSNLFVDELNAALERGRLSAWFEALLGALGTASPFVILAYGAALVLAQELTLGQMLAMSALAVGFLGPLSTLVSTALSLQLMRSYLERIGEVLDTPREQEPSRVGRSKSLRGAITLENVTFRYHEALPEVVQQVSLEIEPGSFVAIVGASGAGKTTLAHLMLGLVRPTEGRILFDGNDLGELDLRSVRSQIGIVTQTPFLFGGSVRDNLSLAAPGAPFHRIVEAATRAGIHDDIVRLPMGYETALADGGASLSGGQRQRLALARALVHRPAILLLDEATSHLDALTERRIQDELLRLRCTRVVIAHRLSTIQQADLILVLDGGRLVETGTHDLLRSRQGKYRQLISAQLQPVPATG